MEIKWKVKKCRCCFPFYCGHKKIILSNWDYALLIFVLINSPLIKKTDKIENGKVKKM